MNAPYDSYDYQTYWENRDYEDCCERVALKKLFKEIDKRGSLLDIGGGFGRLCSLYQDQFEKCLVLDPSEKLLCLARQKTKAGNISFKKGSLPKLKIKDESFDVALLIRVSHHLLELKPSFQEIHRILGKKGFLVIEVANKIHFLARVKAWLRGEFDFSQDWRPVERRSPESISENLIDFANHHPQKVIADLKASGFVIRQTLSVSNFRSPWLKKILPQSWLQFLEDKLQVPLAKFFFGPSIFILAQKR